MGIDIFTSGNSSLERLIQTIIQYESQPRYSLEDRKTALTTRNTVLSDLDSKLSSLHSLAKKLTDPLTDYFASKTASTSNSDVFAASADSTAFVGNHDVTIERLASSDTRVSKQYASVGTNLRSFFDTNGSQTFEIEVAHPTDEDSNNRVTVSVNINATGATDKDVLKEIALAINDAMAAKVSDETITADERMTATVVTEVSGKSRLQFKSGQSGFTNRLNFTDSANSLLSTLEVTNGVQAAGTSGGYITAVGTTAEDSPLNSKLAVDGLTFYRDNNNIDDVITGTSLTLKNITTKKETLKISADSESVRGEIESFIKAYNDVATYLKSKSSVDPETKTRGALAGDTTYTYLRTSLRSLLSEQVAGLSTGAPSYLFQIGISANNDGTLKIADSEKFENAVTAGSSSISNLFKSPNGVANKVLNFMQDFVKVGGILDESREGIGDQIKSVDRRLQTFDARMAQREEQLRLQFAKMQEASLLMGRQSAAFSSLASMMGY
jgi:flagellar hook-associated protein 2